MDSSKWNPAVLSWISNWYANIGAHAPTLIHVQLDLFPLLSSSGASQVTPKVVDRPAPLQVGCGQAGERVGKKMLNPHSLRRLEQSVSAMLQLELWLACELELSERDLLHLFSSLQTRMSVIQAIAWPSEDAEGSDVDASDVAQ